jgi:hypothetical protein
MRKAMAKFLLLTDAYIDSVRYRSTSIIEKSRDWKGPTRPIRRPIGGNPAWHVVQPGQDVVPLFRLIEETAERAS